MVDTFVQNVRFDDRGLIAAVLQDAATSEVIALRYINKDTLARSLQTGETDLFTEDASRPGTYSLLDVRVNHDGESLTVLVQHVGDSAEKKASKQIRERSRTPRVVPSEVSLVDVSSMEFGLTVNELYAIIADRKEKRPDGSYTTYLFNSGLDKILKKVAEESGEVIIAAKNEASGEMISGLADLFYHLLVLMVERDVKLSEVGDELTLRAGRKQLGTDEP